MRRAGAVANLIALPEGHQNPAGLADAIRVADGRTLLPETTAGGYGDKMGAPRRDWKPERLGAEPPMALVHLRQHVESTVLACFGIGAPLGPQGWTDGTAAREAARRLWTLTVQPLGDLNRRRVDARARAARESRVWAHRPAWRIWRRGRGPSRRWRRRASPRTTRCC